MKSSMKLRFVCSVTLCLIISFALVVLALSILPVNQAQASSTLTLRPNGAGDETSIPGQTPDSTYHWDKVDEASTDEDTTYLRGYNATYDRDLYALPNHTTETGRIDSVTIYFRIRCSSGTATAYAEPSQKSGTTITDGTEQSQYGSNWVTESQTYTTNPATGNAYTWAEIDALQIGVRLQSSSTAWCTQVYAEVNYTIIVVPTVTTQAATDLTSVSFTGNGNITNIGGENDTRRGFCYKVGVSGDPTTADSTAYDDGSFGTGAYTKAISGLAENTGYRVRAYAVNSAGTGYGATAQVNTPFTVPTVTTQAATDVTGISFTGNGNITATGENATRRGFCYKVGVSGDPTTADSTAYDDGSFGTGAYTKAISGLAPNTGYRVRAYAINSGGTGYGATVQVTTLAVIPTVTTQAATDLTSVSFTGNGNITNIGGENDTRRGFCYKVGVSGDPTTADSTAYDDGSFGTGAYTKAISGLAENTGYRVRAYAVNSAGTGYGATAQVNTPFTVPTVTTQAATDVTGISFTGNGNITATGENATRRGFCYKVGVSGDPTTADSTAYDDGSFGTGAYTKAISGLAPNTGYRVRAYAINSGGTGYGATVQVTTRHTVPTSSANLTIGSDATIYILSADITINGVLRGSWSWQYGDNFTDLSENGNTAYPSFRTTSTGNLTANIESQQSYITAVEPPGAESQSWQLLTDAEKALLTESPQGLYGEGGVDFPGGQLAVDTASDMGLPVGFILYPLAFASSIGAGVYVMHKTHRPEKGIRGSLALQAFTSLFVMIIWVAIGGGVISGWTLIPFGLWAIVILIFRNPYNPVTS